MAKKPEKTTSSQPSPAGYLIYRHQMNELLYVGFKDTLADAQEMCRTTADNRMCYIVPVACVVEPSGLPPPPTPAPTKKKSGNPVGLVKPKGGY